MGTNSADFLFEQPLCVPRNAFRFQNVLLSMSLLMSNIWFNCELMSFVKLIVFFVCRIPSKRATILSSSGPWILRPTFSVSIQIDSCMTRHNHYHEMLQFCHCSNVLLSLLMSKIQNICVKILSKFYVYSLINCNMYEERSVWGGTPTFNLNTNLNWLRIDFLSTECARRVHLKFYFLFLEMELGTHLFRCAAILMSANSNFNANINQGCPNDASSLIVKIR